MARVTEVPLIALAVGTRTLGSEFAARKVEGRGVRVLPRSGQRPEKTVLRSGELVTFPVLNQEHPLIPHVTSPT